MKVLIRFIRRLESGVVEHSEREFVGDRLTLGRATSQDIHLRDRRVALEHADIRTAGAGFEIVTRGVSGIIVNETFCRKALLKHGDVIYIGSNILRIIQPPHGFDFAFTFELDPTAREDEAERSPVRDELVQQATSKRAWSWGLFLTVIVLFLLVPALVLTGGEMTKLLTTTPLPDDSVWLSGPLHPTHQLEIGDDCSACHEKPFAQVRDSACLACHTEITHHVGENEQDRSDMQAWRCQTCHKEHNEPEQLVLSEDKLCADCHVDVKTIDAVNREFLAVGDFEDHHPQFRVSMLSPVEDIPGSWQVERLALDDESLSERSGLRFPHDEHLLAEGLPGPDGNQILACGDCHQAELSGAFFRPIRMAEHCRSCHVLEFDGEAPDREVPHAPLTAVKTMLEEYFANKLLTGRIAETARVSKLKIPGQQELTPVERSETLAAARERANETYADLVQNVCAECHVSHSTPTGQSAASAVDPDIAQIRFTTRWMPKAHFSHAAHTAGLDCGDCHAATSSSQSTDVLMPLIEDCRDCHGRNLASTCITCHGFHLSGTGPMAVGNSEE